MFNIAQYLPQRAAESPQRAAVICSHAPDGLGRTQLSFAELNADSDAIARGLLQAGLKEGTRTLVLVRPGLDFIAIAFALFKAGAVPVLIDPGMGRKNLFNCIAQVRPEAMIAVPLAHAARVLLGHEAFADVKLNVTVGTRWFWGGLTLAHLRRLGASTQAFKLAPTTEDTPAAILFTTGSTGIPKGVLYTHGMFGAQVVAIREEYKIEPGEVDLPAFPLFALFSTALGTTCVIPDMDPTRPAQCDPAKIVAAIQQHNVTYTFGSPAIWKRVGPYCVEKKIILPSVKRVLMAGAPVRAEVLAPIQQVLPNGNTFIPYGATEALPVANMLGSEVLNETWALTRQGKGYCVGRPLPGMTVKVIDCGLRIADCGLNGSFDESLVLPPNEIGEIAVKGPVVTREYFNLPEQTRAAKLNDSDGAVWHRMGDMGYFDDAGRLWFCGRKAHRVIKKDVTLYSVCVEAQFDAAIADIISQSVAYRDLNHVHRTALVGIGPPGTQTAAILIEVPYLVNVDYEVERAVSTDGLQLEFVPIYNSKEFREWLGKHSFRGLIDHVLVYKEPFPVDIRHNAKINREELARWAEKQLATRQTAAHT